MNKIIQSLTTSLAAAGLTSVTLVKSAFAQFAGEVPDIGGIPEETDPKETIADIINAVLNILALVAVVIVIIAGIRLIVSQGEDEQKDKAKKTIIYALIGLAVVLFAKVIVGLVTEFLYDEVA